MDGIGVTDVGRSGYLPRRRKSDQICWPKQWGWEREKDKRKSHELAEQKGKWILFCFIFILVCFAHGVFFHSLVLDVIAVLKC